MFYKWHHFCSLSETHKIYTPYLTFVYKIFNLNFSTGTSTTETAAGPEHLVHFPHQQGTENRPKIQLECNFKLLHCIMSWFPIQWPYPPAGKDSRTKP